MNRSAPPPFFTVVIPTHHRDDILKDAICSVLEQSFDDFELLVVDDGPSIETEALVRSFDDPRVHYLVNDRVKGGAGARNVGILQARGEWIAFLDDDDVWLPKKLKRQYQKIQACDNGVGMIYTAHASYDFEKGTVLSRSRPGREGWLFRDLLYDNFIGGFNTVAFKRDLLLSLGGLDERFLAVQDADLFLRVACHCEIAYVDEVLVHVRKNHPGRISDDAAKRLDGLLLYWYKYRNDFRKDPGLRYRIAARVFLQAISVGAPRALLRSLPWTLMGLKVDPESARRTFRRARRRALRKYARPRRSESSTSPPAGVNR